MTDYTKLIKSLREEAKWAEVNELVKPVMLSVYLKEAADAIERLQYFNVFWQEAAKTEHENEQKWIPVTEQLPKEKCERYWICTDSGYQCQCRWTNNRFGIGESNEWGWSLFDVPQYQKVIAWRKLPEPYEPPKEDY